MYAVSIRRPFAYMVSLGEMDIVPMSYKVDFRGIIALHVSSRWKDNALKPETHSMNYVSIWKMFDQSEWARIPEKTRRFILHEWLLCDCIIGDFELLDIEKNSKSPFVKPWEYGWKVRMSNHYVIQDVVSDDIGVWEYNGKRN